MMDEGDLMADKINGNGDGLLSTSHCHFTNLTEPNQSRSSHQCSSQSVHFNTIYCFWLAFFLFPFLGNLYFISWTKFSERKGKQSKV